MEIPLGLKNKLENTIFEHIMLLMVQIQQFRKLNAYLQKKSTLNSNLHRIL